MNTAIHLYILVFHRDVIPVIENMYFLTPPSHANEFYPLGIRIHTFGYDTVLKGIGISTNEIYSKAGVTLEYVTATWCLP